MNETGISLVLREQPGKLTLLRELLEQAATVAAQASASTEVCAPIASALQKARREETQSRCAHGHTVTDVFTAGKRFTRITCTECRKVLTMEEA